MSHQNFYHFFQVFLKLFAKKCLIKKQEVDCVFSEQKVSLIHLFFHSQTYCRLSFTKFHMTEIKNEPLVIILKTS